MISEQNVGRLRIAALIAITVSLAISICLFLRAGERTPRLLLLGMAFWVLSPFAILVWLKMISTSWPTLTRAAVYCVTLVITFGTLAVYGDDALGHRRAQAAFVYVIVPPVSWLLIAVTIPVTALFARRRSRQDKPD
ncbi:MAG: hypothetical protein WAO00_15805 [Chthoniobacterales bacterium]